MAMYIPSNKPYKKDEQDMLDIAGEAKTKLKTTFPCGLRHLHVIVLADQQGLT